MKIKLPCAVPAFGVNRYCGDAAVVCGEGKRHDFHFVSRFDLSASSRKCSLRLEKGTFGLVRAARVDNDKPI
jgi:hypothetical protein